MHEIKARLFIFISLWKYLPSNELCLSFIYHKKHTSPASIIYSLSRPVSNGVTLIIGSLCFISVLILNIVLCHLPSLTFKAIFKEILNLQNCDYVKNYASRKLIIQMKLCTYVRQQFFTFISYNKQVSICYLATIFNQRRSIISWTVHVHINSVFSHQMDRFEFTIKSHRVFTVISYVLANNSTQQPKEWYLNFIGVLKLYKNQHNVYIWIYSWNVQMETISSSFGICDLKAFMCFNHKVFFILL